MTKILPITHVEENFLVYYQALARLLGGEYYEQDGLTWFTTGRRSLSRFNGVLHTELASTTDFAKVIEPLLSLFFTRQLPFFWVDWPDVGTPGLGDYLEKKAPLLVCFSVPAMTRSLQAIPFLPGLDTAEIVEAHGAADQAAWLDVLMEGFAEPEAARPDFRQFLAASLVEPQPVFQHFLARWQGLPCAISSLLHTPHSAGIYHVTTLPAFRGRGLGKALTLQAMHVARAAGQAWAVLAATPDGYPVYQRLGFETVAAAKLYAWNG